jgi:hypothetical protein
VPIRLADVAPSDKDMSLSAVPEPSSLAMAWIGLAAAGLRRMKGRKVVMRRYIFLFLSIAATCFASPLLGSHDASKATADPSSADAKAKKAECLLLVRLSKTAYKREEKITPEIEYENQTNRDLTIWSSGFWPNHKIIVEDEAGHSPPLSARGKQCRAAFAPAGGRDKNAPIVIKPGEKRRAGAEVDVASLYELEAGKQYTMKIVYDDRQEPTPLKLPSKAVKFKME